MNRKQRTRVPPDGEQRRGRAARGQAREACGVRSAGVAVGIDLRANDPDVHRASLPGVQRRAMNGSPKGGMQIGGEAMPCGSE